ncbi:MAG: caspase family protein [Chitinophagales bacterium]
MRLWILLLFAILQTKGQQPHLVIPLGHSNYVVNVKFSSNGKLLATASLDNTARIWDTRSGRLLTTIPHDRNVRSVNFNVTGTKLITASADNTAVLWDVSRGIAIAILHHSDSVNYAAFTPKGDKVITAGDDNIKIWDATTGKLIDTLPIPNCTYFTYSPDGRKILACKSSYSVAICDLATKKTTDIAYHNSPVTYGRFNPNGKLLFTDGLSDGPYIWSPDSLRTYYEPEEEMTFGINDSWTKIAYAYSGKIPGKDLPREAYILIKDFKSGALLDSFAIGRGILVHNVSFFPGDSLIVYNGVEIIDLKGRKKINSPYTYDVQNKGEKYAYNEQKKLLAMPTREGAEVYDVTTWKLKFSLQNRSAYIGSASFNADETEIYTSPLLSANKVWNASTGTLIPGWKVKERRSSLDSVADVLKETLHDNDGIWSTALSPDKKIFVKDNDDGYLLFTHTLVSDTFFKRYFGKKRYPKQFTDIIFTPDGSKLLLVQGYDHKLLIYHIALDSVINVIEHINERPIIAFTPDGQFAIVSGLIDAAFLIDLSTGKATDTLTAQNNLAFGWFSDISLMRFSHNGKLLAALDNHGKCIIWEVGSGKIVFNSAKSQSTGYNTTCLEFSVDDKYLYTGNANFIDVWDIVSQKIVSSLKVGSANVRYISFNKAGTRMLCTSTDNTISVWDWPNLKLLYTLMTVDSTGYLAIDPFGRFDGNEEARRLLYYTCGTETIELEQIKDLGWEPGLVSKLEGANTEPITAKKLTDIDICNFTPEVEEIGFSNGIYSYTIKARRGGIGQIQVYVNGKQVKTYVPSALPLKNGTYQLQIKETEIKDFFSTGNANVIEVKATTAGGDMKSRGAILENTIISPSTHNPDMYVVSIGISTYKSTDLQLGFAAKDASDFLDAINAAAKKLLNTDGNEHVHPYLLNTESGNNLRPFKATIKAVFDTIKMKAIADDIVLVFFAGHGVLRDGERNFYLLTAEATGFNLNGVEKQIAISTDELNEWMAAIKANKQILVLDACNSGRAIKNLEQLVASRGVPADQQRALENLKDKTGTFILSASAEGQPAYETSLFGQGLLTYSLLSGIKLGDGLRDGRYIDISRWFNVASDNVRILAKDIGGRQEPQIIGNGGYNVGLVDAAVRDSIKLSIRKKVFGKSKLIDDELALSDELNLSALIDKELTLVSGLGKQSAITFSAENTLTTSCFIRGRYQVNGDAIIAHLALYKGQKERLYEFELTGSKKDIEELAANAVVMVVTFLQKHSLTD